MPCLAQPLPYDIDHRIVQAGVEVRARSLIGVVVPAVVAAVGIQVAAELYEELEGEGRAVGEFGEVFDRGEEREERGGEGRGGQVGGERVLEAMEIAVQDGHFAVDVVVEGLCAGGIYVHGAGDARGDV